MSSIGVKLPLTLDVGDGFTMNKSMARVIQQNFKMLLLTDKGERVMNPDYGVGVKRFLFENDHLNWQNQLIETINSQTTIYMPYVIIEGINVAPSSTNANRVNITIKYRIKGINITDFIALTI